MTAQETADAVKNTYAARDHKIGGKNNHDDATEASRRLAQELTSGNADANTVGQRWTELKQHTANDTLVSKGVLPNVALAFIQDDGGEGAENNPNANNFKRIANGGELELQDLEAVAQNPNASTLDKAMIAELNSSGLLEKYFKPGVSGTIRADDGREVEIDGSYTREDLTAILKHEKSENPVLKNTTDLPPQNQAPPERSQISQNPQQQKLVGEALFQADNTSTRDGLVSQDDIRNALNQDNVKNNPQLVAQLNRLQRDFNEFALPSTHDGKPYIHYDRDLGILRPASDAVNNPPELSQALKNPFELSLQRIANQEGDKDGKITQEELTKRYEELSRLNAQTPTPRRDRQLQGMKAIIDNWDKLAQQSPDGKSQLYLDANGRVMLPVAKTQRPTAPN